MRRPERLAEALLEKIAEIVGFELDDPRVDGVTVTDLKMSPDKRDAKVFIFTDGGKEGAKEALKALTHAVPFIRRQLALNLSLRHIPQLHFARDTAEENAARVGQLLNEITVESGTIESTENEG